MQFVPQSAKYMSTPLLLPGECGIVPLAVYPDDRWLRRKAHVVFSLEALVVFTSHVHQNKNLPAFLSDNFKINQSEAELSAEIT